MMNVDRITTSLAEVYEQLKAGEIDHKNAAALANISGKIIKANLGQLAYYEQRKETPVLPFFELPKSE